LELESTSNVLDDPLYLSDQLITYIGNKRSLQGHINSVIENVRADLGGRRIVSLDAFSGSGIVSRLLKRHSDCIWTNDLEDYATVISRAYLSNKSQVDIAALREIIFSLNEKVIKGNRPKGFIAELYAPLDDRDIQEGERVFYSTENAQRLDAYAQLIKQQPSQFQDLLYGPLLSAASVHANTGGVFKGFYKDTKTGLGKFGGSGGDALKRILAPITIKEPILSRFESEVNVIQGDAAKLPDKVAKLDLAYLDPPYNQHPYGSNYFMLNLLLNYKRPNDVSRVSGIPTDWNRSDYNIRQKSFEALSDLVQRLNATYTVISFSDDGFLDPRALTDFLQSLGEVKVVDIDYSTFKGSRNLSSRPMRITEHLFILKRD
jgi:adenine-specific DNA-methyltransferase